MARIPTGVPPEAHDELQVVARSVLLDGIEALNDQAEAITVVGAQAVYLHSAQTSLTVPAFTSDADFCLDLDRLGNSPLVEEAMTAAGFVRRDRDQPGLWIKSRFVAGNPADIGVDLLVGEKFAGRGGRSVEMPPHDKMAGRRAAGLETAVVDADVMEVSSLDPSDGRVLRARVAGPAALMVAKGYKISERVSKQDRIVDKDAADVVRLMLATEAADTAERFSTLLADDRVGPVATQGLQHLHALFGADRTPGTEMAARALAGDRIVANIGAITRSYLAELPDAPR